MAMTACSVGWVDAVGRGCGEVSDSNRGLSVLHMTSLLVFRDKKTKNKTRIIKNKQNKQTNKNNQESWEWGLSTTSLSSRL